MTNKVKASTVAFAGYFLLMSPAFAGGGEEGVKIGVTMSIIMWACFFVLLLVGGKIAWGPILEKIDEREARIKDAVANADKIKEDLANAEKKSQEIVDKASAEAKKTISEAKEAASKIADELKSTAKAEAESLKANALKEIEAATSAASASLKKESAELAISLAGKILADQLDEAKGRALTTQLIEKI